MLQNTDILFSVIVNLNFKQIKFFSLHFENKYEFDALFKIGLDNQQNKVMLFPNLMITQSILISTIKYITDFYYIEFSTQNQFTPAVIRTLESLVLTYNVFVLVLKG